MKRNFRLPGPIELHKDVYGSLSNPMINHRGPEYAKLLKRVIARLKRIFQTENDVLMLNCSGTGALEAVVANLFSARDSILVISNGFFGDRLKDTVEAYCNPKPVLTPGGISDIAWGEAITSELLRAMLKAFPGVRAVYMVHNETSTGVTNPVREISETIRRFNELLPKKNRILFMVDAVSSLGGIDLRPDEWGIDVVVTGSQKALGAPPGLSFVSLSQWAWAAYDRSDLPKYYWDFRKIKNAAEKGQPLTTPPLPTLYGLDRSLDLILDEGLENVFQRHMDLAQLLRSELQYAGFHLLVQDADARSDTVTAVKVPEDIDADLFSGVLKQKYRVHVAGCPGKLSGLVFRIGHMGCVKVDDISGLASVIAAAREYIRHIRSAM